VTVMRVPTALTRQLPGAAAELSSGLLRCCLALAPLCAGCLVSPPAIIETPAGTVRAPNEELAAKAAQHVTQVRALLSEQLPGLRDVQTDVWIQQKAWAGPWVWLRAGSLHAFTMEEVGSERPRIHVPVDTYEASIVHEMVHALLDKSWDPLPAAIEEGLCDHYAILLSGDSERRLGRLISVSFGDRLSSEDARGDRPSLTAILEARQSLELHEHGGRFASYTYGLGFALVSRIVARRGVSGLHELCRAAADAGLEAVPPGEILDAAGVRADARMSELIQGELEEALFIYIVESGELLRLLDHLRGASTSATWDPDGIRISYQNDKLGVKLERRLVELPGYRAWARENPHALRPPAP